MDYQSSRVSYTQQSVFLSLGRYLYWWTISPRGYHTPCSQCFYHWVDTSTSGLLVLECITHPVVSVSITGSRPLLVDYQSSRVSYTSSQCFYHWVDTSTGGLLVLECIKHQVISVSISGSIPLLVDYQSSSVSYSQQSVFLSLGLYLYWWTISRRGYHTPSSQCFYHWVDTSTGGLLVLECIIHPLVSVSITGSIPLLVDYQSSSVSYTQQSVFLSLGRYLYWWTISPRVYHTPSNQCFYQWVDTSTGGLLVLEGIIPPVVSVSITGSRPLLVDYQSSRVSYTSSQCFYHWVDTSTGGLLVLECIKHQVISVSISGSIPLLVDYQSSSVSYSQQSVFLSLGLYLYWWTISRRGYHTPSSQCFYHWVDTSTGGLLVLECIIHPLVSVSITGSIPLLVDYQSSSVSYTQQSVFLSLGRYLYWWTISPRVYHTPSNQCFYQWVDTSTGGLLVLEGIIPPVVSVSITRFIPLLVDYQASRVSYTQQTVFLSLGR